MKKLYFLMAFALCFLLCGCMGYREVNRGYMVTAMGFGAKDDQSAIYIEALSASDMSDKKQERILLTGVGNSNKQAYQNLKSNLVKPLYFEQLGAVVFEKTIKPDFKLLGEIANINPGIYIVLTDDANTLFEGQTPSGILGYDIITLIKTREKETKKRIVNQLYKAQGKTIKLPTVNIFDKNLILKQAEDSK